VAANAILWAANHYKREHIVGFPAWKAIVGNSLFPNLADKFLGKTGYDSQQTSQPKDPDQKDNLFESVQGDWGSHGRFDRRAKNKSVFFEITKYVSGIYLFVILVLIILLVIIIIVK
ncbi:MAG: hypothetical protein ACJ748_09920, partial [Flavisolibacter sp.]